VRGKMSYIKKESSLSIMVFKKPKLLFRVPK